MPDIIKSFEEKVHEYPPPSARPPAHISSSGTVAAEPPSYWAEVPYDFWNGRADKILKGLPKELKARLEKERVAATEPGLKLYTEGDVTDAGTLFLTNPIHAVLGAEYGAKIEIRSQYSRSSARVDKAYTTRHGRDPNVAFALLEYKNYGVIDPTGFKRAQVTSKTLSSWSADPSVTQFGGTSEILLKQAIHYFDSYGTRYVALCDLNTLLLVYLEDAERNLGGERCLATVITNQRQMRRALLGFIGHAYLCMTKNKDPPSCPKGLEKMSPPNSGKSINLRPRPAETTNYFASVDYGLSLESELYQETGGAQFYQTSYQLHGEPQLYEGDATDEPVFDFAVEEDTVGYDASGSHSGHLEMQEDDHIVAAADTKASASSGRVVTASDSQGYNREKDTSKSSGEGSEEKERGNKSGKGSKSSSSKKDSKREKEDKKGKRK